MKNNVSGTKSVILILLALIGLALSIVSLHHYVSLKFALQDGPSFCNINQAFNCDLVNQSRWAEIFGFPLAGFGIGFYLLVALIAFLGWTRQGIRREESVEILLFAAIPASLYSLYLFYVSEFIIGSLCLMCFGMYLCNFLLLAVAWISGRSQSFGQRFKVAKGGVSILYLFWKRRPGEPRQALIRFVILLLVFLIGFITLVSHDIVLFRLQQERSRAALAAGDQGTMLAEYVRSWKLQIPTKFEAAQDSALTRDYTKGDPNAPIRIVEFADYECPACQKFHAIISTLIERYPGKIHLTFRNFPLDMACNAGVQQPMHEHACWAAEFSRCAGEQDKFWEANRILFEYTEFGQKAVDDVQREVGVEASALGINTDAINECIQSGRQKAKIKSDIAAGEKAELQSTPTFWINEKRVPQPREDGIQAIIDSILSQS